MLKRIMLRYRRLLPYLIILIIIFFIVVINNTVKIATTSLKTRVDYDYVFYGIKDADKSKLNVYKERISREKCKKIIVHNVQKYNPGNPGNEMENKIKIILDWMPEELANTNDDYRNVFTENKCEYTNCILTNDKKYLKDVSFYDAILFNRKYEAFFSNNTEIPSNRDPRQKYVFVSSVPAQTNLVLDSRFDNFFNWTWTYRHESDIVWKFYTIHDSQSGKEIGPSLLMTWPSDISSVGINETLKTVMVTKTRAAAWFAGKCLKQRLAFVKNISNELENYGWQVDIFGKCGEQPLCENNNECIKIHHYFYLAFEDAVDDDYVTDRVLVALNSFAIPVVFGGGEYSRFLPPNSYLNARALGAQRLAYTMNRLIRNMTEYYSYLEWINHYQFRKSEESKQLCGICKALNDKTMMKETSYYKDFRNWWNRKRWTEMYDQILKVNGSKKFSEDLVKTVIDIIL